MVFNFIAALGVGLGLGFLARRGSPKPPLAPPAPPPPPERKDTQSAVDAERKRRAKAKGHRSTILTSPLGLTDQAPGQRKTLLGG